MTGKEEIISFEALWCSLMKCRRGVGWKPSVMHCMLNAAEEITRMHRKLAAGTWKNGEPRPILITFPKRREGLSIPFRDRVYQRSINDNALYPAMARTFIAGNAACQKGKGTDFARKILKRMLWKHYCRHGREGFAAQLDISGYYRTMRHEEARKAFRRELSPEVFAMVESVLDGQYAGDVGYNPGSQMVQIAGISVLSGLDHYIKERLRVKAYLRYMDDFLFIHEDAAFLEEVLQEVSARLAGMGFAVNRKKTGIRKLSEGFRFLGFDYRMTGTGKIVMTIDPANVKHERKKLFRMAELVKKGKITRKKADECYRSWKAHASKGNTFLLLRRMDNFYHNIMEAGAWRSEKLRMTPTRQRCASTRARSL